MTARVILITAPAGYGKTTLAAEWLRARDEVAWYRATAASADLAVFSTAVADAVSPFAADVARRVGQRLQVGDPPEQAAQALAAMLADDLAEWPEDAWLAIDDYHLVTESPNVERFMASLLELAPIRLLVTSRRRPAWATARKLLYGELVEVGADQLAMRASEAAEALGERSPQAVEALVAQADGWPAVIGLAALTSSHDVPQGRVSDVLFRYFADEVLRQEPPEVQEFMLRASVPLTFTLASARDLLEGEGANEIVELLKAEALLHEEEGEAYGFHPLLRSFLRARLEATRPALFAAIVDSCVAGARAEERWDEAFDLASGAGRRDLMLQVATEAAEDLFDACRLETLERWLSSCQPFTNEEPGLSVAQARLLLRSEEPARAEALVQSTIERLAESDPSLSRAWLTYGSTLYAQARFQDALDAQLRARDCANSLRDRTRALWNAAITASMLSGDDLDQLVSDLSSLPTSDPGVLLISAHARVVRASRSESLAGLWDVVQPLLHIEIQAQATVRLKFLNGAAYVALSRSDYATARRLGQEARELGYAFRIGDDRAWPLLQLAAAELATRDFASAMRTLDEIQETQPARHPILRGEYEILKAKQLLFSGGARRLVDDQDPATVISVPESVQGEYFGILGIAAAACGEAGQAVSKVQARSSSTRTIESRFYPRFAALIALAVEGGGGQKVTNRLVNLLETAEKAAFTDAFVIAYRAYPPLLELAGSDERSRLLAAKLLAAANDHVLAGAWGYDDVASGGGLASTLTKREAEVLELLSAGLTNAQIAEHLWVSSSTAKVHVHNVLRKLGVKTRTQAVIAAHDLRAPSPPLLTDEPWI